MWCKTCRQDVPAVHGAADERPCCIRCGSVLPEGPRGAGAPRAGAKSASLVAASHADAVALAEPAAIPANDLSVVPIRAPLSAFDTWDLEEQLRHVERILSGARFATELAHAAPGEQPPPPTAATKTRLASTAAAADRPRKNRLRSRLAWTIVATGAAALACGILLLCAGSVTGRARWQSIGLPITLLGQVALLLGMMMQLDLAWHGKRETASKLYLFQKRLVDLEALAAEIDPGTSEEPAPPADERELMAELKSRLDLLSHRLNVPCG
jgi:hypothetical protein